MLDDNDCFTVLNSISSPVLVISPIYDENQNIVDFLIEYVNQTYFNAVENLVQTGDKFSDIKKELPITINWFPVAVQTVTENRNFEADCFSDRTGTWFHITMNKAGKDFCVLTLTNIDKVKKQEKQLDYLAHHDSLTGLPNRAYFNQIVDAAIVTVMENKKLLGLMLIDIDNMKAVNDISGHTAGDEILKASAKILQSFKRKNILPFRLGDDEYLILVTDITSKNEMITICDTIFEAFQNADVFISAGISLCPADNTQASNLLKYADLAMHHVKKTGKNNIIFFQPEMYKDFLRRETLQQKLMKAVDSNNFELHFQPQFDIKTNELRGFEALLRWYDNTLGWIKPDDFIPIAEETHTIIKLGQWVLETALDTLKKWQHRFEFGGIMSVNVSPSQLKKTGFIFDLFDLLKRYNIQPGSLELEITEGVFIDNMQQTITTLTQIRDMGILISLDDFGTGYSSFRYLQMLPITTLKIDKAFISNLDSQNGIEANITNSIVSLVSKMGLDTIAEGVERIDQLDILKTMNCKNIQGFLRGKPMDKKRCESILNGDLTALVRTGNEPLDKIIIRKKKNETGKVQSYSEL